MLAAAPLKKDFIPSLAKIFTPQSIDPLYFSPSPEVIIILLLMVSIGQEASPAPTVTPQPNKKFMKRLSLISAGRLGLTESQMPKQRPLQITIPTHEITKPLQRPAIPSEARVFLQTSMRPVNCFSPPFLEFFKSFESLVLAQSREQTNIRETEPAAPPEARFPANQTQYPSLFLSLPKSLLKQSLKEKLRAWVGKYLKTLVPLPFQRAFTPSSATTLLAQFTMPVQGVVRAPDFIMASMFWSLSLINSMGAARVLETAAETPPIKNSVRKVLTSFFFPDMCVDDKIYIGDFSGHIQSQQTSLLSLSLILMSFTFSPKRFVQTHLFLSNLSYRDLLSHLSDPHIPIPHRPIFIQEMALKHNSLPLFQIAASLKKKTRQEQWYYKEEKKLSVIEVFGFSHLHRIRKAKENGQSEHKKLESLLIQALQGILGREKIFVRKMGLLKIGNYLPNYVTFPISASYKRIVKQLYLQILQKTLFCHQQDLAQNLPSNSIYRFFPVELFNLTDQPLIGQVAKNYLLPSLPTNNIRDLEMTLIWVFRLNLRDKTYIQQSFKTIEGILMSQSSKANEKLAAINCLYLISRKIFFHDPKINEKCNLLLENSRYLLNVVDNFEELLRQTLTQMKSERRTLSELLQTFQNYKQSNQNEFLCPQVSDEKLTNWIFTKVFRGIMLHLSFDLSNSGGIPSMKIFENKLFRELLQKNLLVGDFSAEVLYLDKLLKKNSYAGENIGQGYLKTLEKIKIEVVPQFNSIISKNQKNASLFCKVQLNRLNHFESMISLQNMEIISGSEQYGSPENRSLQIAKSLLNQNDFLSIDLNQNLRTYIKEKIQKSDLRNIVKEPKDIYPFYPDLEVSHPTHNSSRLQIYLRNSFSQKSRCPFWEKESRIFNISDLSSCAEEIKGLTQALNDV